MRLRRDGHALRLQRAALAEALPAARSHIVVLAHGLCMNDLQWQRSSHHHGAALEQDLDCTPLYLHYNSGLPIALNGRRFARLLEMLVAQWPVSVERLSIVGHSMGGLVARSACVHGARHGHTWLGRLDAMVFLGTPHRGAPLERGGHWFETLLQVSPYSAPFARLGKIRSAGITDLRHSAVFGPGSEGDQAGAHVPPLPEGVRCLGDRRHARSPQRRPEGSVDRRRHRSAAQRTGPRRARRANPVRARRAVGQLRDEPSRAARAPRGLPADQALARALTRPKAALKSKTPKTKKPPRGVAFLRRKFA